MTFVAPLTSHLMVGFIVGLGVLLLTAWLLGRLAERCRMPAVVGELTAGVLIGPSVLGHLAPGVTERLFTGSPEQMHLIDAVGQVGVLLLVAVTGTHLDPSLLRRVRATAATVSLGGLLLPLAAGIALGYVLPVPVVPGGPGDRTVFALFLGVAMCVSAIPVIAKTLTDMRLLHRNIGQLTLAAAFIDDALGWLLLSVVAAAATAGVSAGTVTASVLYLVGFLLFAATLGRVMVRKVMTAVADRPADAPAVATAVILVLFGAATTLALGMEPVFGAFVAGLLITGARTAQPKLAGLRTVVTGVLAPLFLATAGLRMDLTALARPQVAITAAVVLAVAIVGKFAGAYLGARLRKLTRWEALALGAGMNSRGVIEVIVALTGLRLKVLDTAGYTVIVLVAIVTSVVAPPLLRHAMNRIAGTEDERLREIDHDTWNGLTPVNAGRSAPSQSTVEQNKDD
ncbi:cation:proton antiporter [Dactylosporangium sp. NPDC006015]|uniref:cation:proton antiporter n=1 Tax=Dactylosporangium sp. NPDC006015 TaxID=3154576 RepID=UPI0033BB7CF4